MAHKILAIDDHPETLSILVTTLKSHGYRVLSSNSPIRGLKLATSARPDLLLVDMNMPEMNGIELVRRVRDTPQGRNLPIIMFTAETDAATKIAGVQAGVDDYITKPTDVIELIERVEALLERPPNSEPANEPQQPRKNDNIHPQDKQSAPTPPLVEEGQLVALCGVRGGVGTTTITMNLAYMLALMKHPTTLVDFDLRQGHIGLYLNKRVASGLNDVANMATSQLRQQLLKQRVQYRNNLHLLLTQPNMNGRLPTPNANETAAILETMLTPGQYIVADLGQGITNSTQPTFDRADHLILCLPPERIALAAAKRYIGDIKASLFFHTTLHILVCDMNKGVSLSKPAIEKYLNHPVLGILPIRYKELVIASNKGVPLIQAFPKSPTLAALYKICLKLFPAKK